MNMSAFDRRILICTTGMSPQVVTETLFALAVRPSAGQQPWVPTEVHLISTRQGAEHARLNLLSTTPGWFHKLRADYGLPPILFTPEHIHCIEAQDGQPLEDIRTPADNEATADRIAELIRSFSQQESAQLHVSIAGGRKTMGYYLGYAMSLYGRAQDRLSHVLVNGAFESHPEFYYPTPYERVIHTRDPKNPLALDCRNAQVDLAEIPFVRLRDGLPQRLLHGHARFTETIEIANLAHASPVLRIDLRRRSVEVSGLPVALGESGFALYAWLAKRALTDEPEVDWTDPAQWDGEFVPLVRRLFGEFDSVSERIEESLRRNFKGRSNETAHYFLPLLSRVNKALEEALGEALARRVQVVRVGEKRGRSAETGSRYRLPADLPIEIES
jgi:CRISPR-associated protein (TIGR02584 family)